MGLTSSFYGNIYRAKPKKGGKAAKAREASRKAEYTAYLRSDRWKKIRAEKIKEVGGKCQHCWATKRLQVHHLSYDFLGREELAMSSLLVLCRPCHKLWHRRHANGWI